MEAMTISERSSVASAPIADIDPELWAAMEGSAAASTTRSS
jgi:hypothetical protein